MARSSSGELRPLRLPLLLLLVLSFGQLPHLARSDAENLQNTPPRLERAGQPAAGNQVQARFIPFSASVNLGAGSNAHSFSVAGGPDGIGLSQSSSHGNQDYSASQSSSLAAGLNGISASDSTAHSVNHPFYGPNAQATGNSFSVGQASSAAHGNVVNGQAATNAQSSVGSTHTQAGSNAQNYYQRPGRPAWTNAPPSYANGPHSGNYYYNSNRRPSLTISVSDYPNRYGSRYPSNGWYETSDYDDWPQPDLCRYSNSWYRDPRCRAPRVDISRPSYRPAYRPGYSRPGYQRPYYENYENIRDPRDHNAASAGVAIASAGSSAQSGPGGLSIGQSSSQSGSGKRGQGSVTINNVQTSGNAQAQAQGASGNVQQLPPQHHLNLGRPSGIQASLSSGSISASSRPGGSTQGSSVSISSPKGDSSSKVTGSSQGAGSTHGSANAGSVVFPGGLNHSNKRDPTLIPPEFVRSSSSAKKMKNKRKEEQGPIEEFITDLADVVYDALDD